MSAIDDKVMSGTIVHSYSTFELGTSDVSVTEATRERRSPDW